MIVNFPKFPPLKEKDQLDFVEVSLDPRREIEVFYKGVKWVTGGEGGT